jgi:hypothetical protein
MRVVLTSLLAVVVVAGCVSEKERPRDLTTFNFTPSGSRPAKSKNKLPRTASSPAAALSANDLRASQTYTNRNTVITLLNPRVGRVATVNLPLRFVVLDFSLNPSPATGDRLNVYRRGQKVGEVNVTGPELNHNIAADIVAGEAQPGDEVRSN